MLIVLVASFIIIFFKTALIIISALAVVSFLIAIVIFLLALLSGFVSLSHHQIVSLSLLIGILHKDAFWLYVENLELDTATTNRLFLCNVAEEVNCSLLLFN